MTPTTHYEVFANKRTREITIAIVTPTVVITVPKDRYSFTWEMAVMEELEMVALMNTHQLHARPPKSSI